LDRVASSVPEVARALAEEFWPGPLTIVLAKSSDLSDLVTAGGPSVGVRVPDHPVALALLTEVGTPIVATSANLSGQPPALTARGAIDAVGSSVAVVLDSGRCEIGVPSTVVDVTTDPPTIPRHGAISDADIHRVISRVRRGGE
jgi:L-threonylcarbamoyladenylate synthase